MVVEAALHIAVIIAPAPQPPVVETHYMQRTAEPTSYRGETYALLQQTDKCKPDGKECWVVRTEVY